MPANLVSIINLFDVNRTYFVQDAYNVILGRDPDPSGSETYEKKLGTGAARRRAKIIIAIAKSPEARARSLLLPMIAEEAVRIQRWRFLPWNRSAIAFASAQAESPAAIEVLAQSLERKLSSIDERLHPIERRIEALAQSSEWKLNSIDEKLPPIDRRIESLAQSMEWKLSLIEQKLPLIEHTMRSMKGISFVLQRLENRLDQYGVSDVRRDAA